MSDPLSLENHLLDAQNRLQAALLTVDGLRVPDVSQSVSPPAAVIGPPKLSWDGYGTVGGAVLSTQWNIYLILSVSQYAINNLMSMVAKVTAAIEKYTPGIVLSAAAGSYVSPTGALPAYVIVVMMEPGSH